MDANDDANGFCFPYDVLLDILHRLPARILADSRRVCHAWRTIIDAHSLLLPHAFPREFPGIYTHYYGFTSDSALFARPMSRSDEPGIRRPFSWGDWGMCVQQHCNGLLLVRDSYQLDHANEIYVCNPTTVRVARLPRPPMPWPCNVEGMFLAFDPAMSRYHKVFLLPSKKIPNRWFTEKEQWELEEEESYGFARQSGELEGNAVNMVPLLVFSSQTGQWEEKKFAPGRCAPGHIYDVVTTPRGFKRLAWSAEYWHGSLYVHCHSGVLLILRCSEGVYDMVQLPGDLAPYDDDEEGKGTCDLPKRSVLASYERGVCYVTLNKYHLLVWTLIESTNGQLEWTLAHEADLRPHSHSMESLKRKARPRMKMEWELVETDEKLISLSGQSSNVEIDEDHDTGEEEYNEGEVEEVERSNDEADNDDDIGEESNDDEVEELGSREGSVYSWNSDEHNFIDLDESDNTDLEGYMFRIIGLHPHKDALLLNFCSSVAVYHLGTSRMQYLGDIFPKQLTQNAANIRCAFPYRPCYFDALPHRKSQPS